MSLRLVSSGKGILAVLVCDVLVLTAVVSLSPKAAAEQEPTYVVFMVGGETDSPTNPRLAPSVKELKDRFGVRPSGSTRYIGFTPGLLFSLNLPVETLRSLVDQALDIAEQADMPVFFHLDDMHFWWKRTELHEDPRNVEWSDFPDPGQSHGPVIERYWLNWGQFVVFPAPPPNYEGPAFRADVVDHLTNGIGTPVAERLAKWRDEGREYLFAGIGMGNETEVPVDLRPLLSIPEGREPEGQDGSHQTRERIKMRRDEMVIGGYHALAMRGWTREKMARTAREQGISEEQLFIQLRHEVAHDYAEFRAKTLLDAGVPSNRSYTHFVSPFLPFIERFQPGMVSRFPPIKYAVNPWSRPGFTVTRDQVDLEDLAKQVHEARQSQKKEGSLVADCHWGVIESYVGTGQPGRPQTKDEYSAFLGGVFSHGATLVNLYGWGGPKDNPFSVQGAPGVAEAVADWASGKPLPPDWKGTKPENAQLQDPGMRIGAKVNQLQQVQAKRRKAGVDVSQIEKIMAEVGPLLQNGKVDEAEKLLDSALKDVQGDNVPASASQPAS